MTVFSPTVEQEKDEVVLRASLRDPSLFRILVGRYQAPFLRKALTVVRDPEVAEDIVQETFVKMYRYAERFKKQEGVEFKSWAYKILMNTAFTHYGKLQRERRNVEYLDGRAVQEDDFAADETYLERAEFKTIVQSTLQKLPQPLAAALAAYYLEDKSYVEIAKEQRITLSALKMRLFRAKRLFRKYVAS